jgi:diguanylate cyclase (GGDEF)-like protein
MPGIAADRAGLVAERIRSRVEKSRGSDVQPDEPTTTVSIGLTTTTGSLNARGLVAQADQALYRAKRAGKNCVRVFEAGC